MVSESGLIMNEMTEAQILERKIELKEQHLLLILLDLEAKRERLAIFNRKEANDKMHQANQKSECGVF